MSVIDRLKKTWNAFLGRDPTPIYHNYGGSSFYRPDRLRLTYGMNRSIVNTIYNRMAVDCSMVDIKHVKIDENERYTETIDSSLNQALNISANIDQTGKALIQDIVMSMFDEGCVAVVPTVTDVNPRHNDSYKIYELRVGKIIDWFPHDVRVRVYNEDSGQNEEIVVSKGSTAIIENPFYSIMNEPNSMVQRLIKLLAQLDRTNEQNSSGKLDLIIQLPYPIKSQARMIQAEERKKQIEQQLTNSVYGIAYIDTAEKIVPLNRSLENNLWNQATELEKQLYNQFGLTEAIFNGTAKEEEVLNYYNRTIDPIMMAITNEMERKFLTKTARTQRQAIRYFQDPFRLVPVKELAEIADKFTRNEIMSSNEIRAVVGMKPSDDPRANELINSNLNHPDEQMMMGQGQEGDQMDMSVNVFGLNGGSGFQNDAQMPNPFGLDNSQMEGG